MKTRQCINGHITSDIGQYINCIQGRLKSSISQEWNWTDIGRFVCLLIILTFLFMAPLFAQPINEYCPVTTSEKVDINIYVDDDGQRIYFCCNRCRKDFLADPNIYLANINYGTGADSAPDKQHDHSSHAHPASTDKESDTGKIANQAEPFRHDNDAAHDHSTDHGQKGSALTFIGKFHPVVVHFPIALVLAGLLITGIGAIRNKPHLDRSSVLMIYLAASTGTLAAILGLAAGAEANFPSFLSSYFTWHRILGIASSIIIWIAAYFGYLWQRNNSPKLLWTYRLVLGVNSLLIGITGHLGATLVYGPDHFNY